MSDLGPGKRRSASRLAALSVGADGPIIVAHQPIIFHPADPSPQRNMGFSRSAVRICYDYSHVNDQGGPLVDTALKVNVVVACAVFCFIGAILLGAF